MTSRQLAVAIVLFTCLLSQAIAMERPGGESPEAVVARMGAAMEAHDYRDIMACLTTEAEIELSLALTTNVAAGLGVSLGLFRMALEHNPDADDLLDKDAITAIEKKLGVLHDKYLKNPLVEHFDKIDRVSLVEEYMAVLKEVLEKTDLMEDFETTLPDLIMRSTELTAVEVDGATAAGRVGEDRIAFRKIDKRWFIDLLPSNLSWRYSDPYKLSVQAVEASDDVVERFGSGFRFLVPNRSIYSDGVADLDIPIEGELTSGTAYVTAEHEEGAWQVVKLSVEFDDRNDSIDLIPGPSNSGAEQQAR